MWATQSFHACGAVWFAAAGAGCPPEAVQLRPAGLGGRTGELWETASRKHRKELGMVGAADSGHRAQRSREGSGGMSQLSPVPQPC